LAEQIGQSLELQEDLGLLYLKILNLRRINNTLGYGAGDALLQGVQSRLGKLVRKKDLLARVGDSEFVLILSSLMGEGHAILAANKILRGVAEPLVVGDAEVAVQIVLGIALLSKGNADAETLLGNAETAMLTALADDLDYSVYSQRTSVERERDWALDEAIHQAVENGELEPVFQPKVALDSERPVGLEVLIQWNSPEYGVIPPPKLRRIAERTGKLSELTWWALKTALRTATSWPEPWDRLPMSINLSAGMLHDQELAPLVLSAVSLCGVSPGCLTVEIAQELALTDPPAGCNGLQQLQEAGVGVCIDAFGIGCASLAALTQVPVNELKIHGSFIGHMREDRMDRLFVKSVVQLAENFGFRIAAEGVGDSDTAEMLRGLGCHFAQGPYFAAPMPERELMVWLSGRH
jgi:diguanylate cyclase (GGDEF)-like protein